LGFVSRFDRGWVDARVTDGATGGASRAVRQADGESNTVERWNGGTVERWNDYDR